MKVERRPIAAGADKPTKLKAVSFWIRSSVLKARRAYLNARSESVQRCARAHELTSERIAGESRTSIWTSDSRDRRLVAGKVHNLRTAIREINGVEVSANEIFSFWRQLGRPSRRNGYVVGRELREGCLIPSVGGGLCQLSNALYDSALQAGLEIVERHAHTQVLSGSLAEQDRDATVFWNYVDLRFRARFPFRIEAELTTDTLIVRMKARSGFRLPQHPLEVVAKAQSIDECVTCTEASCFRKPTSRVTCDSELTAFLLDEHWPEFDRYIQAFRTNFDTLMVPLSSRFLRKHGYSWCTDGFAENRQARWLTLLRSYRSRTSGLNGAQRQSINLDVSEKLANHFTRYLTYQHTHLVVMQNLLPFLWRAGHLGGRTYDVLMTGLPLSVFQHRLDEAFSRHPESGTLSDFRAPDWLVNAEDQALQRANRIISPHSEVTSLFPNQALPLRWVLPQQQRWPYEQHRTLRLLFPSSTLGRKGIYELREAIGDLDVELVLGGPLIEDKNFWQGIRTQRCEPNQVPRNIDAVVSPSIVESKPRFVLRAVAAGLPVIATEACGLKTIEGVTTIGNKDAKTLQQVIEQLLHFRATQSRRDHPHKIGSSEVAGLSRLMKIPASGSE